MPKVVRETGVDEKSRTYSSWSHVVTMLIVTCGSRPTKGSASECLQSGVFPRDARLSETKSEYRTIPSGQPASALLTRSAVCLALAFESVPCPFAAAADRRNPA